MNMEGRLPRLSLLSTIAVLVYGMVVTVNATEQAVEKTKARTVTLGLVSEIHRAQIEVQFQDFVRYVAEKLSATPDFDGKIMIAPSAFQLARLIEQKKVDFYMESPYPTFLINDIHGVAKLLLRRWKSGMAEYRSLIFAKNNGEVRRLEDLRGKVLVFEDPGSTSGHFLAKSFLLKKGFKFADKSRFDPHGSPTEVGYVFANSQEKLVDMVLAKQGAAGAFSDDDFARLDDKKKSAITILAETERVPRHFFSVRNDFAPSLVDRLEKILLSMHENEQGRRILKNTDDTTKFDLLPDGAAAMRRRLAEIFHSAEKN
jgi:ABC-type phosphate/phosphonate transport system substrate-binding protein